MTLTQSKLKEELNYIPETGEFIRLKSRGNQNSGSVVNQKPNKSGYIEIRVHGLEENGQSKKYKAHRLAWLYMTGEFPEFDIDHINGIRNDNTWLNLRQVEKYINNKNKRVQTNSPSGVLGVTWNKVNFKWQVNFNGKYHGSFDYFWDAVKLRKILEENHKDYHKNHSSMEGIDLV